MFGTVDETGRLFLFESTGNVYDKSEDAIEDPQFRIKLLEDLDGDGVYDKSTLYAYKVPGRKEPTSGEINYPNVLQHIYNKGYRGFVGMEHGISKPGKEGTLAALNAYRKIDPKK